MIAEMPVSIRPAAAACIALAAVLAGDIGAAAHNPTFAPGPRTVFEGGVETTAAFDHRRSDGIGSKEIEQVVTLGLAYGVTDYLSLELDVPVVNRRIDGNGDAGLGEIVVGGRFRFYKKDRPGLQQAAAVLFAVKAPTSGNDNSPALGTGSTDFIGGIMYGLTGRILQYNAAYRYRYNGAGDRGLEEGDKQFFDLAAGYRQKPAGYRKDDTLYTVELNLEYAGHDKNNGGDLIDTGGWELFLSPGVIWSQRRFALHGGIQIPIAKKLNGGQVDSDYRVRVELRVQF